MEECKKSLESNLFILHHELCPALLMVKGQCEVSCEEKLMAAIEENSTYTLEEFKTCHSAKLRLVISDLAFIETLCFIVTIQISASLSDFHKWVKDVIRVACEEALKAENFVPDPVDIENECMCGYLLSSVNDFLGAGRRLSPTWPGALPHDGPDRAGAATVGTARPQGEAILH